MNILIVYNSENLTGKNTVDRAVKILEKKSAAVTQLDFEFILNNDNLDEYFKNVDVVISVGGDGTMIKVAKIAAMFNLPILGINAGKLGYLTSIDAENLDDLYKLFSGDYIVENRIMLKAEKFVDGSLCDSVLCLNDFVLAKSMHINMINFKLSIDNDVISYKADGLIAATPTGSTAYSMSAGGPIIDPSLNCMILTPVCPHTLLNRSMVINDGTSVTITLFNDKNDSVNLSADGRNGFTFDNNCVVKLSIANVKAKFIKLNKMSVYKVFSKKMCNE